MNDSTLPKYTKHIVHIDRLLVEQHNRIQPVNTRADAFTRIDSMCVFFLIVVSSRTFQDTMTSNTQYPVIPAENNIIFVFSYVRKVILMMCLALMFDIM